MCHTRNRVSPLTLRFRASAHCQKTRAQEQVGRWNSPSESIRDCTRNDQSQQFIRRQSQANVLSFSENDAVCGDVRAAASCSCHPDCDLQVRHRLPKPNEDSLPSGKKIRCDNESFGRLLHAGCPQRTSWFSDLIFRFWSAFREFVDAHFHGPSTAGRWRTYRGLSDRAATMTTANSEQFQ